MGRISKIVLPNHLFFSEIASLLRQNRRVVVRLKGTSMLPTLREGVHSIVLSSYKGEALPIGTIALFQFNNNYTLHRLIASRENRFIFRGDNLQTTEEVPKESIIGVVKTIVSPKSKSIDCTTNLYKIKAYLFVLFITYIQNPYRRYKYKLIHRIRSFVKNDDTPRQ